MLTQTQRQTSANVAPSYLQALSISAVVHFDQFLTSVECAGVKKFRGYTLSHVSNSSKIFWP